MFGLNKRVSVLENTTLEDHTILREHLRSCDARGKRMERALWGVASGVAVLLWHLLGAKIGIR